MYMINDHSVSNRRHRRRE